MFKPEQLRGKTGDYRTQSLFVESSHKPEQVILSLSEYDKKVKGKKVPSLRKIYMEIADPTEYEFAMHVFGSWRIWERITGNKLLMKHIQGWRDELEVKLRSQAVRALVDTATAEGAKGTTAAKYIAEKGWVKRKAGAPSNEEKERELKIQIDMDDELKDIADRIDLH